MRVIDLPPSLEDKTLDLLAELLGGWPPEPFILDARAATWANPIGFAGLLSLGDALRAANLPKPRFLIPDSADTRSYWARNGFFHHAAETWEVVGRVPNRPYETPTEVLLPITPIRVFDDVNDVVGKIQERAQRILAAEVNLAPQATVRLRHDALGSVPEHRGARRRERMGDGADLSNGGNGWDGRSPSSRSATRASGSDVRSSPPNPGRWESAGETAPQSSWRLMHNVSRYRDPGRGQGLYHIRSYVTRWQGKMSVRSGTARITIVPPWDDDTLLVEHLPFFPGSQVQIIIPAQEEDGAS